eukprot:7467402-Alexandrium_andersonii.AAC.1
MAWWRACCHLAAQSPKDLLNAACAVRAQVAPKLRREVRASNWQKRTQLATWGRASQGGREQLS